MEKSLYTERHKKLIKLLIEARENAGLTQAEFAERLGEYQSFVARLESGQRRVDIVELIRFSEVLGFEANSIINELIIL